MRSPAYFTQPMPLKKPICKYRFVLLCYHKYTKYKETPLVQYENFIIITIVLLVRHETREEDRIGALLLLQKDAMRFNMLNEQKHSHSIPLPR